MAGARLGPDERGAIWPIYPKEAFPEASELRMGRYDIPHEDIRTTLLFFDKIDIPIQRLIVPLEWCQAQFASVGVLCPSQSMASGDPVPVIIEAPYRTFLARDRVEPGRWTLARPAQSFGIPEGELSARSAVALTFHNALPTFARDVPLDEVLAFKLRAWSELLALRAHIDRLCIEVGQNGTNSFEHSVAFQSFKSALDAHTRLMAESNRTKAWSSLRVSCDLPAAAVAGVDLVINGQFGLGTLGAGAAYVAINTVRGLLRKRDSTNPFEYLTSAHLEL